MGCMQCGRQRPAEGAEGPSAAADSKLMSRCKQLRIVDPGPDVRSAESFKIRLIWRRVSIFDSRRDSIRSTKSTTSTTALPGPSSSGLESSSQEAKASGEKPPLLDSCPAANREGE